ncbi:MAG: hypothetical protein ACR2RB_17625 [Gammaproteobacteria bacterium]
MTRILSTQMLGEQCECTHTASSPLYTGTEGCPLHCGLGPQACVALLSSERHKAA